MPGRTARKTRSAPALTPAEVKGLVASARQGDRDAFGMLYEEYRRRIFNLARFSLPFAAAEDVVAETFVRAWVALPRYRDVGVPFVAWLYGIARHVVADAQRVGCRVEPRAEPRLDVVEPRDHDLDRLTLGAALDRLPDEQRRVIELKFLAGLTNGEVAAALGKTPGAVNTQQWRALATLRTFLEEA
ncbi:MAG: sigma-70 family RNA polymerase sigma factor [Actinobacteria bacterium]|nr:sigma-70 family RNA polymerase sigma factor [Actinomycetota bacterium]